MAIPLLFLFERVQAQANFGALQGADVAAIQHASISAVYLFEETMGADQLQEGALYIGRVSSAKTLEALGESGLPDRAFLLVDIGTCDAADVPDFKSAQARWAERGIIVTQFDVQEVFNKAITTLLGFQEWLGRFCLLLEHAKNADELMRECSALFGNAAYLVDSSFRVIAIDDSPLFCEISSIWKHLVDERYLLYDIVYNMQKSSEIDQMSAGSTASLYVSGNFNNPFINYNLSRNGVSLGHFFVVGYQKRITPGEIALANFVGEYLTRFVERFGLSKPQGSPHGGFVLRLMDDKAPAPDVIARQIEPWGWNATADKLCVIAVSDVAGGAPVLDILVKQLEHELGAKPIPVGNAAIALVNVNALSSAPGGFDQELESFLRERRCVAGMSDMFTALECKALHFRQATQALQSALRTSNLESHSAKRLVLRFSECFGECLVSRMAEEDLLFDFVDGRVSALVAADQRNSTDYARTLETYLLNERHLNETARMLFVHRNTLLYRIGRLKQLLNTDFEDPEERLRLQFSLQVAKLG